MGAMEQDLAQNVSQKDEKQEEVKWVADNRLLYTYSLWKHADNEDGIVPSIYRIRKGWTSTRELVVKKEQDIFKYFRRLYDFWSSLTLAPPPPPIQSVNLSRPRVGVWPTGYDADLLLSTTANFKKERSYTSTPHIYVYGVMPDKHKENLYYFLPHRFHICTKCKGE
jgi:hypothetical protein